MHHPNKLYAQEIPGYEAQIRHPTL